jgi:hypothetical protein
MKCNVCGTELTKEYYCPYCGYDGAILTKESDYSEDYRNQLLNKIRNIALLADSFVYDTGSNVFEKDESCNLFKDDLHGTECYCRTCKSRTWVAHLEGKIRVTITYSFGNRKKELKTTIDLEKMEGIWFLGVRINQELRLELELCVLSPLNNDIEEVKRLNTIDLELF